MSTKTKGDVGENACAVFLVRRGFSILARNYRKKWGELDIVAIKDGTVHFFEVKSTTLSRGYGFRDIHRPEDNVHQAKRSRLRRTIMTFLAESHRPTDSIFCFHVLVVDLNLERRKARVKWIKDVIL